MCKYISNVFTVKKIKPAFCKYNNLVFCKMFSVIRIHTIESSFRRDVARIEVMEAVVTKVTLYSCVANFVAKSYSSLLLPWVLFSVSNRYKQRIVDGL